MELFRGGKVAESIDAFDRAIQLDQRYAGLLWQRGLSLYYADRFSEAAEQFARDVALNPRDTEEAVWALLSQARAPGGSWEEAQKNIITIRGETRPYMKLVYEVCEGKTPVRELEEVAEALSARVGAASKGPDAALPPLPRRFKDTMRPVEAGFYLCLYAGLVAEAQGREDDARRFLISALQSPYSASDDYMWSLAKVHCTVRGWAG